MGCYLESRNQRSHPARPHHQLLVCRRCATQQWYYGEPFPFALRAITHLILRSPLINRSAWVGTSRGTTVIRVSSRETRPFASSSLVRLLRARVVPSSRILPTSPSWSSAGIPLPFASSTGASSSSEAPTSICSFTTSIRRIALSSSHGRRMHRALQRSSSVHCP